jgi:lactoylglutathione lyase
MMVTIAQGCIASKTTASQASSRLLPQVRAVMTNSQEVFAMKFLHTMIRVNDLDQSIDFYCNVLGMKLIRKKDYPNGQFTLAFVGYGDESENTVIELTYNWDTHRYDLGNAFGHLALGVDDIYKTCDELRRKGAKIVREPGPMKHGGSEIAFIEDPNGYKIELIDMSRRRS